MPFEVIRPVALRKESVDRNYIIKITGNTPAAVALRKESVDRNHVAVHLVGLSAVALRKESVDRNPENPMIRIDEIRRSPQGERG